MNKLLPPLREEYDKFAPWFQMIAPLYYESSQTDGLVTFLNERNIKPSTILDCACGCGWRAIDLARSGFNVDCSDFSGEMLRIAQKNAIRQNVSGMGYYQSEWKDLNKKIDKKYDCIINLGVSLYHVSGMELRQSLESMICLLNPGGLLLVDNKVWRELLFEDDGLPRSVLVESRPIARVLTPQAVTDPETGCEFVILDICYSRGAQWIIDVIRLAKADLLRSFGYGSSGTWVRLGAYPLRFSNKEGGFQASYDDSEDSSLIPSLSYESIILTGFPVKSRTIAKTIAGLGIDGVEILDRHKDVYKEENSRKASLYEVITALKP